jgi:YegS/Rv2252/BmrU family lipid kinase
MARAELELLAVLAGVAVFVALVLLLLRAGDRRSARAPRPAARRPAGRRRLLRRRGRRERGPAPEPLNTTPEDRPLPAVVVNPTKFDDIGAARDEITQACTELGWDKPLWLETTADDPGMGQALTAIQRGADVVMACGGDGTVRCVGQALAGTGVALGLLPAGTGNLLARNLDMNFDGLAAATRVALTGDDRHVDVGRITVDGSDDEQVFLVMAGMGFDAEVMANVPEALKARVGPIAYTVAGMQRLKGRQARVRLVIDGEPEILRRVRTVVIGNCGKLLGGLVLMPDAEIDDGVLDIVALAPKGVVGWVAVAHRVVTRRRRGHRRVEHWRARAVEITADRTEPAQLDGDPIGEVSSLQVRVDPGALTLRVRTSTKRLHFPVAG